jgi:hypothetical protein
MTQRSMQRIDELDIAEDLSFERRSWIVQRVTWMITAVILLAALLGVFGNGPLSTAQHSSSDGSLRIEYERFVRSQTPAEYRIHIAAQDDDDDRFVQLWVSRDCFDDTLIKRITPEPSRTRLCGDGIIHEFLRADDRGPIEVQFRLEIEKLGRFGVSMALVGRNGQRSSQLDFTQFAYP